MSLKLALAKKKSFLAGGGGGDRKIIAKSARGAGASLAKVAINLLAISLVWSGGWMGGCWSNGD